MSRSFTQTRWHRLLGALLEALLTPVGIAVETEIRVMADSPRADILLLRRTGTRWSEAQRQRLADGLRDTDANHLLIEFKRTEGLGESAFIQLLSYDYFYRQHRQLKRDSVASFLVSATTPATDILVQMAYRPTAYAGIYTSTHPLLQPLRVILLNELTPAPHNTFLKCFASRRKEQQRSFTVLQSNELVKSSLDIEQLIYGLWRLLMKNAPEIDELTPEYVRQVGQEWLNAVLKAALPAEEVMQHFSSEERLAGLKPEERLAGLKPEERLVGLKPEERLVGLKPEERLAGLKLEERLAGLKPEEFLAALDEAQIRQYLEQLEKAKQK